MLNHFELTRIARERIGRAVAHLSDETADTATRVHEARKRFKEIRAILRLGRFGLDGDFAALNVAFRDAARALAATREYDALAGMAKTLRRAAHDPLERRALTRVARVLGAVPAPPIDIQSPSLPSITFAAPGADWIARGLRKTYRDGRRAFREARAQRTATAIHEWRKRVKDLWYEMQIVAPSSARVAVLHELSRLLGDHHDVVELAAHVAANRRLFGKVTVQRIAVIAARRLAEIEHAAFDKGGFLYAAPARAWVDDDMIRAAWA